MTTPQATALDTIRHRPTWLTNNALNLTEKRTESGIKPLSRNWIKNSNAFHLVGDWYEDQTGVHSQLGLSFCPARDVPLDLSLVHAVHGQPHQSPANHQAPEGIPLSWVRIQAGAKTSSSASISVGVFCSIQLSCF